MFGEFEKPILLGIVEGLTEFIPVSSTGHLILFGEMISYKGAAADTFEVFIQLGAILAVVFLYPKRFLSFAKFEDISGIIKLSLACLPAFVLGFLFHSAIKELLFKPIPVAIALALGGMVMIFIERREATPTARSFEEISYRQSFLIGIFQCLALWPGVSRSGATIVGGMILGLKRTIAAEFSFLVAVPVMMAATLYDLYKSYESLGEGAVAELAVGFVVSFVVALIAIRTFIALLDKWTLSPFGYYRILLGIITALVFMV